MPTPSPTRRQRSQRWLAALLAWAVVLLIGMLAFGLARSYFAVPETRAPDVIGRTLEDATRTLRESGLQARTYPVEVPGARADVVMEQSPAPGALIREGRTVDIGVHVQAEANQMPALVGASEADAVATLRAVGMPAPEVTYVRTSGVSGRVVAQRPPSGQTLQPGDAIHLEVSRGPQASDVELPDVTGLDVADAVAQLTALGLRRVETVAQAVSTLRPNSVTRMEPPAGTVVAAGQPVTLGYAFEGTRVAAVPDLLGADPTAARVQLLAAGLRVGPVQVIHDSGRPWGVVETRPSGTTVAGSVVALVVNVPEGETVDLGGDPDLSDRPSLTDLEGRDPDLVNGDPDALPEGARRIPFRFDPNVLGVRSLVERGFELRLVVRDDEGERTVLQEDVPAGGMIDTDVVVHGDEALLQTYVNGVFFQAWRP